MSDTRQTTQDFSAVDPTVLRAMAKWPDVPDVFGWLSLDRRGRWLLRAQPITHPATIAFIGRNYAIDSTGRWYFQNGPQRVFVDLAYTPWIFFVSDTGLLTHTGLPAGRVHRAWLDEDGQLVLMTSFGAGLVCDRDLHLLTSWFCDGTGAPYADDALNDVLLAVIAGNPAELFLDMWDTRIEVGFMPRKTAPSALGYVRCPRAQAD